MIDAPVGATSAGGYWAESIGGTADDDASPIRETSDKGFVFSGSNSSLVPNSSKVWLFKTDSAGTKQWEKILGAGPNTFDSGSIAPLADGGYSFDVDSYDSQTFAQVSTTIGKLDANINIVWQKQITGSGQVPSSVDMFSDGSFLITGTHFDPVLTLFVEDLIRVSSTGSIMWQKSMQSGLFGLGSPSLQSDGKLLFVGDAFIGADQTHPHAYVSLLDTSGNMLWGKIFAGNGSDTLFNAANLSSGWLLAGTTTSWGAGNSDIWLVQIDGSGNIVKQVAIGDTQDDFGIPEMIGGTLYLAGSTVSASVPDGHGFLARLDANYNVTSARVFDVPNQESSIFGLDDGSGTFLLEGSVRSNNGTNDIVLGKFDGNNTVTWARRYGGPYDETGFAFREGSTLLQGAGVSATAAADANLILAGSTESFGAGGTDAMLATLDPTGQLPGCSFVQNVTINVSPWTPQVVATTATVSSGLLANTTPAWSLIPGALTVTNESSTIAAICNVTPVLTANATADTTSGAAPLTVNFTGSAVNGTGPYTYDWDFGDGSENSTQQNPTHVYTDADRYLVTLTVTDSTAKTSIDNHLKITVTGGTCTVGCSATVPATGTTGVAVAFSSSATPSNCAGSPTYAWTFGDGGTSSSQNPSHTYAAAGSYNWTLTVTAGTGNCSKSGTITISAAQTCTVSCSATVPTTGTAGVAVTFASSATPSNCAGSPTYAWTFGDGGTSSSQNPSHTYAAAGSYNWTLTVTAGTGNCSKSGTITLSAAQTCTVSCSATVPTTGTAGVAVAFASSATPSNCAGSPTYAWTFGDGGTSSSQNPSHTYAAAGSYNWTLTVTAGTGNCSKSGSITVAGGGTTTTTSWVPSIAHAPGAGTSKWRSNIGVVNRSGASAHLTLEFVPYASGSTVEKTYTLANGATVEWADVLVSLFAFADSANTKGTVKITSDQPIYAISRTYNQAASGTFGQYYPALQASQSISGSQAAVLPLLKKNSAFRTNVGFQNLTSASCSGEVKLFNAAGTQVGTTRTLTAAADKYIQDDDVFTKAAAGNQDVAYARVQATTSGCKAWFYGSVIDAVTNDPTTVPQQVSATGPYWVPSIAHAPGAGTSKWRSNIAVVNRSGSTANLTLDFVPYASGSTVEKTYALGNNKTVEWADVLVSLFGFADSANTKGTVKITSNVALFAISRTYNQADTGTFGQYYPALVGSNAITSGHSAVLPLLKKSAAFRTNVGFENLGAASCTGTIKLFNAAGTQVGSTRTLTAGLDKYIQDDDVFTKAAAGNQEPAYAVVDVTTSGGQAWFYGSVIDATTNDPTTVPQQQ